MGSAAENLDSRTYILRAAYHEIHRKGYRAASLRDILARAGLSKGALYHHFSSKRALGYAVVEELITPYIRRRWLAPLMAAPDPVAALISLLEQASSRLTPEDILHGCALNNLAQEMSPIDAGFRIRLNRVFTMWRDGIAEALQRGQAAGCVRGDVDTHSTAVFLVAAIEGCVGMAKSAQTPELLDICEPSFRRFLNDLRV